MSASAPPPRRALHYAWIVAGVTFLTLLAAAGGRAAPGVMIVPLGNVFQWSRATVSGVIAVYRFLYGLSGPFAAALYQSFGLRRTMLLAMTLVGAGYGLSTLATHYWQFMLLWGVVVGTGSGMAATAPVGEMSGSWDSYAPMSMMAVGRPVAFTTRGLPAKSVVGSDGAELSPASMAGDPVARWKFDLLTLANCGSVDILPFIPI